MQFPEGKKNMGFKGKKKLYQPSHERTRAWAAPLESFQPTTRKKITDFTQHIFFDSSINKKKERERENPSTVETRRLQEHMIWGNEKKNLNWIIWLLIDLCGV